MGGSVDIDQGMTTTNYSRAYDHVYNIVQQGSDIEIYKSSATDEFGEATSESSLSLKAFPVRQNPYDREVIQKISWAENTDIIAYVSKKELDLGSVSLLQLQKKYNRMKWESKIYDIRYLEPYSSFRGSFLYYIIGGVKKK